MAVLLKLAALMLSASAYANAQYIPSPLTATNYGYNFTAAANNNQTQYPNIRGEVIFAQNDMVRLRIFPTSGPSPYIVPSEIYPQSKLPTDAFAPTPANPAYSVTLSGEGMLAVSAYGRNVLSFDFSKLQLDNQQCNLGFNFPKKSHISGYGERNFNYYLAEGAEAVTLSSWNTDNLTPWALPMYGVYPVIFIDNPITNTHAVVMQMNSHAQQATFNPNDSSVGMKAIGGVVDFHVFVGPTALDAMRSYQQYIGPAEVPPYWALGTHQCKYGYSKLADLEDVLHGYIAADIPLEVLWNDIDYMHTFHIFTVDQQRYAGLRNFTEVLRAGGRKYVQIVDPGVAVNELNYSVYQSGEAADIFMKREGKTLVGVVWPGWTTFPDFSKPETTQWWTSEIQKYFQNEVVLDGMWTDMNEIASFCGGACPVAPGTPWTFDWHNMDWSKFDVDVCVKNGCGALNTSLNHPPFNPLTNNQSVFWKTIDMEADTHLGKYYDTKTFYGNLENIATHAALSTLNPKQRPFIVTRSVFTGAGRSTFHWAGDNTATWGAESGGFKASIQSLMASNLGGVFMSGSDIPGFTGPNTTEPLADRWYQVGAFYPFMRNHRDIDGSPQEPYRFSPACQVGVKAAIHRRYRLLPHIFSSLMAGRLFGTPAFMHPAVVFSDQPALYGETFAFMVGTQLLVVPVMEEESTTATGRIPLGLWYWLADQMATPATSFISDGSVFNFEVPRYALIPAFQRAGTMIPMHNAVGSLVADSQASGHSLVFAMPPAGTATGDLIIDTEGSKPIPANYGGVFRFVAQGAVTKGAITVTTPFANGATAPVLQESYVLLFPNANTFTIVDVTAAINGEACGDEEATNACTVSSPAAGKIVISFPQGTNANGGFTFDSITWSATIQPNTDSGSKGGNSEKWKTPFIAVTASLGSILVIALVAVFIIMRRRNNDSGVYEQVDSEPVLPNHDYSGAAMNTNSSRRL